MAKLILILCLILIYCYFNAEGPPAETSSKISWNVPTKKISEKQLPHRRRSQSRCRRPSTADIFGLKSSSKRIKRAQGRKSWTDESWKAFESSRRVELYDYDIRFFELEVRQAQNTSLCNYTVVPIPDPGGRVPRVLEHVKCNYVGNRCREHGSYCCVQLFQNIEVTYPGNRNDTIKLYTGCVCNLQIYGSLKPYNPKLPLDY